MKSIETRYMESREQLFRSLQQLDRRAFFKVAGAAGAAAMAHAAVPPHSFQPLSFTTRGAGGRPVEAFKIAYISDSHLYEKDRNDRFVKSLLRAVDDVNNMDPQPDFVLYGGDLAQLGSAKELELGAQILKGLKAPVRMMVGEHDWYLDLGEKWKSMFGADHYSFTHKGVQFVVLNSVVEEDFWTARGLSPEQRMHTVAGLDNGLQNPFTVGEAQRAWLQQELKAVADDTPLVVFSHSPLYHLYPRWNFWTKDAEPVQQILKRFASCTVVHGHLHQLLTNRIGNIMFHGMLSTAWPWPYAPEGMPELTVQMNRPDPFDPQDGCGSGRLLMHEDGLVDKVYDLWNRNPITITREYMRSFGKSDAPKAANRSSY